MPALVLFASSILAAETRSPEDWVDELSATYAKLSGFTATYEMTGESKELKAVLGLDKSSGLAVLHITATKGDKREESRIWNPEDRIFFQADGNIHSFSGFREIVAKWGNMRNVLALTPEDEASDVFQPVPYFYVEESAFAGGLKLVTTSQPPWSSDVGEARSAEADDKSVVFRTKEYGDIAVSRETGLMILQSVAGANDEKRELRLTRFELNPGKEAISRISKDWNTEGANDSEALDSELFAPLLRGMPFLQFQAMVWKVENEKTDLDRLERVLGDNAAYLRSFAESFASHEKEAPEVKQAWETFVRAGRTMLRERWERSLDGAAVKGREKEFEAYAADPKNRAFIRDVIVKQLSETETGRKEVLDAIFGPAAEKGFHTLSEKGQEAARMIGSALFRAYHEAKIERLMEEHW